MGRGNKVGSRVTEAAGLRKDKATAVAACLAAGWAEELTPEELEHEQKRQREREVKAKQEEQKAREAKACHERQAAEAKREQVNATRQTAKNDRAWQQTKEQALAAGVLEAAEYGEGCWYVQVGKDTWKDAQDAFWCPCCDAWLNTSNLASHLGGERHRKASQSQEQSSASSSGPYSAPPTVTTLCTLSAGSSGLEFWQARDEAGNIKCLACNKYCDDKHEWSEAHISRVNFWQETLTAVYPAPEEPWLAWVVEEKFGKHRWLKCLMCNKFVQDCEGTSTVGYEGHHSRLSESNQKDHKKKMESLEEYRRDKHYWQAMLEERRKWHPETEAVPLPPPQGPPANPLMTWAAPPPPPPRPRPSAATSSAARIDEEALSELVEV